MPDPGVKYHHPEQNIRIRDDAPRFVVVVQSLIMEVCPLLGYVGGKSSRAHSLRSQRIAPLSCVSFDVTRGCRKHHACKFIVACTRSALATSKPDACCLSSLTRDDDRNVGDHAYELESAFDKELLLPSYLCIDILVAYLMWLFLV